MKNRLLVCCGLLLPYIVAVVKPLVVASKSPPNIVLVVADDMGYNDVGFHNSEIYTPYLDELAKTGVILENYYVMPTCTPSRGQLLTGRYGIHTGLQMNIHPLQPLCMPLAEVTIAQKLKERGYRTHMLGKWHLGYYRKDCTPTHRGFDSFYGIHLGSGDHFGHWKVINKRYYAPAGYDFWRNENASWSEGISGGYSTTLYRDEALKIVTNHDSRHPLFMYLSFQAPHAPMQVPHPWLAHYGHIRDRKRRAFAGMMTALDSAVEELVNRLKARGLWENTVLVFTTDNGGQVVHGGNNWPLRGGKGSLWEGGIRGVGFVNSPLIALPGRKSMRLMHVSDWFPTFVGLSRGNLNGSKPLDGYDQWGSISRNERSPRKEILHNIRPRSVREIYKEWKHHPFCRRHLPKAWVRCQRKNVFKRVKRCVGEPEPSCLTYKDAVWCVPAAIRRGRWKLLVGPQKSGNWIAAPGSGESTVCATAAKNRKVLQLYDIKNDPLETVELSRRFPRKVAKLMARLEMYRRTAVPYLKAKNDLRGDPNLNGGVWGPWGQDKSLMV